ncbi:MAG: hypothetical protein QM751_04210 [Paludibacteraceae bacterium]
MKFEQLPPETANYPQPVVTFLPKTKKSADVLFDGKPETFWTSKNGKKQSVLIDLKQKKRNRRIGYSVVEESLRI